jgi:hypothetical protein
MCATCLSTAEVVATQVAFVGFVVKDPLHRALARAGLAPELDLVKRDRTTVHFLRSLDLDPIAILGADTVAAADTWVPAPAWADRPRRVRRAAGVFGTPA